MNCLRKVIPYYELAFWRNTLPANNLPLVATNGCFDLLHPGHLHLLEAARACGRFLLVGLTGDEAIRKLKGPTRPTMPQMDRLMMLAGLEAVGGVCLFPEIDATGFLEKSRPDIYVKGGDYAIETLDQRERFLLERMKAEIKILPHYEARSTSDLLRRIRASA